MLSTGLHFASESTRAASQEWSLGLMRWRGFRSDNGGQ